VHDKTQAVVPGASVRLQNLNDNSTHTVTSDQDGLLLTQSIVCLQAQALATGFGVDGFW
jgi:hypothetical protein